MRNVEIKARLPSLEEAIATAKALSGNDGTILKQSDTFFQCQGKRLKLRQDSVNGSMLIVYSRNNQMGPKLSDYDICSVSDAEGLERVLGLAYGVKGKVVKTRHLFMVGQTRVHLDEVEELGSFLEFEVVLNDSDSLEKGTQIASDLMERFKIKKCDLIEGAYMDLLLAKGHTCVTYV